VLIARAPCPCGGRLVEEDHARVADQGHRQVEPAQHPAGVGGGRLLGRLDQVELVQQRGGAPAALAPVQVVQVGHEAQVLLAGQQLVDRGELAGDADRRADRVGLVGDVVAGDVGLAAGRADQGGQDLHRGGLAGAVGAEQREDRSFGDVQVDAVEHDLVAERLAQAGRRDRRRGLGGRHVPSLFETVALVATASPRVSAAGISAVSPRFQGRFHGGFNLLPNAAEAGLRGA
jgi:hypothetical protein